MTEHTHVSRLRLTWLQREVATWHAASIVDDAQAAAILSRYRIDDHESARWSLGRLLLWLGGAFVGVGLIWLVGANLEQLAPSARFAVVALLWLGFLAGGEVLSSRAASPALTGTVRLMAALAFGALVFQSAQSLQVPAYEPVLVGVWAVGALVHAYLVRAVSPLVVGVTAGTVWWVWQPLWDHGSAASAVVSFGATSVVGLGLAALHEPRHEPRDEPRDDGFAAVWRLAGAVVGLVGLFTAAVPYTTTDGFTWSLWLLAALLAAGVVLVLAGVLARGIGRWEATGAAVVMAASVLLVLWDTGTDTARVDGADWAHAALSVAVYVVAAVALATLGTLRDASSLTWLAMAALVVFTTFQSFAVFAAIVTGAWLFVVLGTIFLGTGFLFDRARRGLVDAFDTASTQGAPR